jgi:hypothetical protein
LIVIDLSRVRRKAVSAKRQNDKDFMKFCEAVGIWRASKDEAETLRPSLADSTTTKRYLLRGRF